MVERLMQSSVSRDQMVILSHGGFLRLSYMLNSTKQMGSLVSLAVLVGLSGYKYQVPKDAVDGYSARDARLTGPSA